MIIRLLYILWVFVFIALCLAALGDALFGTGSFGRRLNNLIWRVAIALVWPIAIFSPRGRYLLWRHWRDQAQ